MTTTTDEYQRLALERASIETLYRAFSENKPELLEFALSPDWKDIPLAPGQQPGPQGIVPIMQSFADAMSDVRIVVHDMLQLPGRAAVRGEITGVHRGSLMGVPASGRTLCIRMHEFHEFDGNGRISTTWHIEDWFGTFTVLGAFPMKK